MDATGLVALESALGQLAKSGCRAILCGLQQQPARLVGRAKIADGPGKPKILPDLDAAIEAARRELVTPTS